MKKDKDNQWPWILPNAIDPFNGIGAGPLGTGPLGVDPMGSYTGVTEEPMEEPVQDADDL